MKRQDGAPVWVESEASHILERVDLTTTGKGAAYDEAWLQRLLHQNPTVLPVEQVESGFGRLIPVCRELPVTFGGGRTGALDNVFVTASGRLVLIEAKLWRNPQARREVVAQAMDYASSVFRMDYAKFERAVLDGEHGGTPPGSLFELVAKHDPTADEATFIDALSRNLRLGRAIVAVVGDGIREDVMGLAELLQSHAGHRFTFLLVELGVFRATEGALVVVPSLLLKTQLVERGVVELNAAALSVREPTRAPSPTAENRSIGIGEDEFYDILGKANETYPALLRALLDEAAAFGIEADVQGGLNLKYPKMAGRALNLGTVTKSGHLQTDAASWWTVKPIAVTYNNELAALIGGAVNLGGDKSLAVRTAAGKTPRLSDFLPKHRDAWLQAMRRYIEAAVAHEEGRGEARPK